ncbi:hypothetical protein AMTR_s00043p00182720 [Amborella trichopoda]|uniref:Uncharacterized protein n=1 Tax=Amborella trichopoda TaxID=13333 RepID=W1PXY7_AMBTC|nr:hypothetical protein AMTR_s00043p00182720 [Amborella trichopoda]
MRAEECVEKRERRRWLPGVWQCGRGGGLEKGEDGLQLTGMGIERRRNGRKLQLNGEEVMAAGCSRVGHRQGRGSSDEQSWVRVVKRVATMGQELGEWCGGVVACGGGLVVMNGGEVDVTRGVRGWLHTALRLVARDEKKNLGVGYTRRYDWLHAMRKKILGNGGQVGPRMVNAKNET